MTFKRGQSGNPAGKPRGARDKRTDIRALLEPHKEKLARKAIELALAGDTTALRLCFERLWPSLRSQDAPIALSGFEGEIADKGNRVLTAMTAGEITLDNGASLMQALAAQSRIVEVNELERRVALLESARAAQEVNRGNT